MQKDVPTFPIRVSVEPADTEQTEVNVKEVAADTLYEQICQRKHLSNGSLRYQARELDALDSISTQLNTVKPGRISKNDLARMALIILAEDSRNNGEESIVAQVFRRMEGQVTQFSKGFYSLDKD